jgi:DNA (cytosine-5)-methyltransferase 1
MAPTEPSPASPGIERTAGEFFAGIGLARKGLEAAGFNVVWSNDIDPGKKDMYVRHFGASDTHQFVLGDIAAIHGDGLPTTLSLAWASFPCVDLSLAGWRRGLHGNESGTFWQFTRILNEIPADHRPPVIVLENVGGLANSRNGEDIKAATRAINELGYSVDILMLDARRFVPQSRPRLFIVGARDPGFMEEELFLTEDELRPPSLNKVFEDAELRTHRRRLPSAPTLMSSGLSLIVERLDASDPRWWDEARTKAFVESLSSRQHARMEDLKRHDGLSCRTAYRRTRNGKAVWEIRPDDVSGCLRTARGGSSKQALVEMGHDTLHVRWMTALEYARLMGAGDYQLDGIRRNQAIFGFGDAVCVPAVAWLGHNYLGPLLDEQEAKPRKHAEVLIG